MGQGANWGTLKPNVQAEGAGWIQLRGIEKRIVSELEAKI